MYCLWDVEHDVEFAAPGPRFTDRAEAETVAAERNDYYGPGTVEVRYRVGASWRPVTRLRPCWRGIAGWAFLIAGFVHDSRNLFASDAYVSIGVALFATGLALLVPVLVKRVDARDTGTDGAR